jgi:hypothetical protein
LPLSNIAPPTQRFQGSLGLIDFDTFRETQVIAERSAELAAAGDWLAARDARSEYEGIIRSKSGVNPYDIRTFEQYQLSYYFPFLNRPEVKEWLHVPAEIDFNTPPDVSANMAEDIMKSTAYLFPDILAEIPVLLYQGLSAVNFSASACVCVFVCCPPSPSYGCVCPTFSNAPYIYLTPSTRTPCLHLVDRSD